MKLRRLRDGDVIDDDIVLVRGGEFDPDMLRADARRYYGIYGTYGIYTVGFDDLDRGVKALTGCDRQIMTNPYHDA
jgi:hypothetical protein